jgi:hypothetical protein
MTIWRSSPQGLDERLIHSTEVGGHPRRGCQVHKWLRVEKNAILRRLAPHAKRGLGAGEEAGLDQERGVCQMASEDESGISSSDRQ